VILLDWIKSTFHTRGESCLLGSVTGSGSSRASDRSSCKMRKECLESMFAGDQLTCKKPAAAVVSEYSGRLHTARMRSSQLFTRCTLAQSPSKFGSSEVHTGRVLSLPLALPQLSVQGTGCSGPGQVLVEHKVLRLLTRKHVPRSIRSYARLGMKLDASP
jgi:hypothetical protein